MQRQTAIGVTLSFAIIATWLTVHVWTVFFYPLEGARLALTPFFVALICWLNVGMFIVAHDAMHGSLAPGRSGTNLWFGRVALALYAGFSFDRLKPKHFQHHRSPGSETDPDFSATHPARFWPWYATFLIRYFGLRELLVLTAVVVAYVLLGARMSNILVMWALPAILSSMQLFYFGTYLPHRHEEAQFADQHNARSNEFSWLASLITCFHFGYHHEHHLAPHQPWWRLPSERRSRALAQSDRQPGGRPRNR